MATRRSTARGQMTKGANSGPAVMLMPPHIRATFMPNPPLKHIPNKVSRRKQQWTGVSDYLVQFEKETPERVLQPTPKSLKQQRWQLKQQAHAQKLEPVIELFRKSQRECGGEFEGMNCYNTLFVGRLAYEVTERKLLREMEAFGPVKDIRIIKEHDNPEKSRGYAFVEYENEEDMKRAYRAADGMKIEGREIVVDVERGHTVPTWLPRRLGGGLGGTRLGGKEVNVTRPGRYDPLRPEASVPVLPLAVPPPMERGGSALASAPYHGGGFGRGSGYGPPPGLPPPPGPYGMGRGRGGGVGHDRFGGPPLPPPPLPPQPRGDYDRGPRRGGGEPWGDRKRRRSNSPDRRHGGGGGRRH